MRMGGYVRVRGGVLRLSMQLALQSLRYLLKLYMQLNIYSTCMRDHECEYESECMRVIV